MVFGRLLASLVCGVFNLTLNFVNFCFSTGHDILLIDPFAYLYVLTLCYIILISSLHIFCKMYDFVSQYSQ